jgi:transposase
MRISVLGKVHFVASKYDPATRARLSVWCWSTAMTIRVSGRRSRRCPSGWGITAETLRSWIRQHQIDDGQRDGVSSEAAAEIPVLKRRNAELEQTNVILKAATSFFVRESDPRNCR